MNKAIIFTLTLVAVTSSLPTSTHFNDAKKIRPQIIGGEEASEKEFPYFANIWSDQCIPDIGCIFYPMCGGVIYDETRIITSAQCGTAILGTYNAVIAGKNKIDSPPTDGQRLDVASILLHENFSEATLENDIAIVTLVAPLAYNDLVQPIRLAENSSTPSGDVVFCGYGDTEEDWLQFKKATLSVISKDECQHDLESVTGAPAITDNVVCAKRPPKSVSRLDAGGPLIAKDKAGREYLAGITSFPLGDGDNPGGEYPSVFADIAHLRPWLDSKLKS